MSERVALLIEDREGIVRAVICNSRERADQIREHVKGEVIGTAPIITLVEAVGVER